MAAADPFVVVGAGLAGLRAAETLRQEGYDGPLVLLGDEPVAPYDRPPLSKEFLKADGEGGGSDAGVQLRPDAWYAEHDVDLRPGCRAAGLDPAARRVLLQGGGHVAYRQVLVATGARVRRLPLAGADLPGVVYLRTLEDAIRLREALGARPRVTVVGAGFIGAEVAAACRGRGLDVTLLEILPVPLGRVLGAEVGAVYGDLHRQRGVDLRTGEGVAAFQGHGRLERVLTSSGATVDCDLAVVGVGVVPSDDWLAGSGVARQDGVVVDDLCRTSAEGVFAAGDVARWPYAPTGESLRVEHWDNAQNQGPAAARAMLGKGRSYDPLPYFWSDQYEVRLQYFGHAASWERIAVRGDPATFAFSAFYLREGRVRAALAVNRTRDAMAIRRLVRAAPEVDAARLADEAVDLRSLIPPA